jgi:hypothetical protein
MTFLRLDDGFAGDPRIVALSDREFRGWLRTLYYCDRYRDPALPAARYDEIGVPDETRDGFATAGLVDVVPDSHAVWDDDWMQLGTRSKDL